MSGRRRLEAFRVSWPEVQPGADLTALATSSVSLRDGDVLVLTSKVVSKAEGRVARGDRAAAIADETQRVVAQRGAAVIVQTRHGLVLAAAGVDASNTPPGTVVLLPEQPDHSARQLRDAIHAAVGRNVAVIVSDTAGRAWRLGQADMAVGCAGIPPILDLRGTADSYGNLLEVTAPAVADELAAAADLVKGKATGCPLAVVRGAADLVLPPGDHGAGAAALLRDVETDLFALGAREAATTAALRTPPGALERFPALAPGDVAPFAEVACDDEALAISVEAIPTAGGLLSWLVQIDVRRDAGPVQWMLAGQLLERTRVLGAAFRLSGTPADRPAAQSPDWQTVDCTRWAVA